MISVKSDFTPVCICIPSATKTRYAAFEMDIEGLFVPANSAILRARSSSPAKNRNEGVRRGGDEVTHYFFIDDDQDFDNDLLMRLLSHKVPFVSAMTLLNSPPFFPIVYKGERTLPNGNKQIENYTWAELDKMRGLQPIFAIGGAGMLVERSVFSKIPEPWFELGKGNPEECREDITFCDKLRVAGIPLYVDTDAAIGHLTDIAVWPVRQDDGRWTVELRWDSGERVRLGRNDRPVREVR